MGRFPKHFRLGPRGASVRPTVARRREGAGPRYLVRARARGSGQGQPRGHAQRCPPRQRAPDAATRAARHVQECRARARRARGSRPWNAESGGGGPQRRLRSKRARAQLVARGGSAKRWYWKSASTRSHFMWAVRALPPHAGHLTGGPDRHAGLIYQVSGAGAWKQQQGGAPAEAAPEGRALAALHPGGSTQPSGPPATQGPRRFRSGATFSRRIRWAKGLAPSRPAESAQARHRPTSS